MFVFMYMPFLYIEFSDVRSLIKKSCIVIKLFLNVKKEMVKTTQGFLKKKIQKSLCRRVIQKKLSFLNQAYRHAFNQSFEIIKNVKFHISDKEY